jgi:hypothetical protein
VTLSLSSFFPLVVRMLLSLSLLARNLLSYILPPLYLCASAHPLSFPLPVSLVATLMLPSLCHGAKLLSTLLLLPCRSRVQRSMAKWCNGRTPTLLPFFFLIGSSFARTLLFSRFLALRRGRSASLIARTFPHRATTPPQQVVTCVRTSRAITDFFLFLFIFL